MILLRISVVVLLALTGSLFAHADQSGRSWDFELKAPGTYKLQVEHKAPDVMPGMKVVYTVSIGTETRSRELELIANRPFIPLVADVSGPQPMRVSISGLPESALEQTRVYAYSADSVPHGEYFDPAKNGLYEVERLRRILRQPSEVILQQKQYEKAIAISDLILEYNPKDVETMVRKAVAYGRLGRERFVARYTSPSLIPVRERPHYAHLSRNHHEWFAKAEALGWREETEEDQDRYLQQISKARKQRMSN